MPDQQRPPIQLRRWATTFQISDVLPIRRFPSTTVFCRCYTNQSKTIWCNCQS